MFTDSHAHIYLPEFEKDLAAVIENAKEVGVDRILLPNIDSSTIPDLKRVVENYPGYCIPMMGLHPGSVKKDYEQELQTVKGELYSGQYVAVGEIGIDLYWDKTFFPEQVIVFEEQIKWAKELGLPVVIHARNSFNEIFEVLDRCMDDSLKGVFHCFTGGRKQVGKILEYKSFMFGIGGIVTFKNSGLDHTVTRIPLDKIILETDSPYLSPVPYRGKRNQPGYLRYIAEKLAEIKNTGVETVGTITENNIRKLFNL